MKAPNKIYLNFPKIQPELDNATWDTKQYDDCENVEYIRKEAIIEKLNSIWGEHYTMRNVREIINSM